MKESGQGIQVKQTDEARRVRPMKKIAVRRTEPIKVTSAPFNHQPLPTP
ncbi:hypothetical protein ACVNF4_35055 [Streptomyces sp. S6]